MQKKLKNVPTVYVQYSKIVLFCNRMILINNNLRFLRLYQKESMKFDKKKN